MPRSLYMAALVIVALAAALPCLAGSSTERSWSGYLIDRLCMKAAKKPLDLDFIKHHTRDCSLTPACVEAGYAVYVPDKDKWLLLDGRGNRKAESLIRKSKRDVGFYVRVVGRLQGDVVRVSEIEELSTTDE